MAMSGGRGQAGGKEGLRQMYAAMGAMPMENKAKEVKPSIQPTPPETHLEVAPPTTAAEPAAGVPEFLKHAVQTALVPSDELPQGPIAEIDKLRKDWGGVNFYYEFVIRHLNENGSLKDTRLMRLHKDQSGAELYRMAKYVLCACDGELPPVGGVLYMATCVQDCHRGTVVIDNDWQDKVDMVAYDTQVLGSVVDGVPCLVFHEGSNGIRRIG